MAARNSQLVIIQLRHNWKVKTTTILPLYQNTKSLISKFKAITIEWIPRQKNVEADKFTNKAYREALESDPGMLKLVGQYMATEAN